MEWISVKDELPEELEHVLLARTYLDNETLMYVGYFEEEYHNCSLIGMQPMFTLVLDNDDFERFPKLHRITHWMELPKSPEVKNGSI